ncbi:phosphatidylglycerol:prolipoprotein diacylglycerol transferase [Pelagirhabdus alkalitolerans]|uniref:Phosphatidylglycerol--prolipoprotein diacylglyceryl transferase n=1 Tax=Pelagirhabdus alkalitolerans TaxID=1612202 RepID=A0A1G6LSI7_9BACI|nr:prolipoprotein diacylglyceryl transferase [Pelagirhabdus alkalitolerans]SDC46258.1 phosphatidylglycerol:prolipoprotein diacylglycerol transferase [Pelagirhabdus alkalitolerans]
MVELFSVGPFTIHFFGLMIALGVLAGLWLLKILAVKEQVDYKKIIDIGVMALLGGVIGARLFYIVFYNPEPYITNPVEILMVQQGGLSIHGGLLAGIVTGLLLLKKHGLPIWKTLDIAGPGIILAQAISRIGCDIFGKPISESWFWGITFNNEHLHPVQAYEFLFNYILLGYLIWLFHKKVYHGQVFWHYVISFMFIRGGVELFRINPQILGFFSVSHLLSLVGIIISLAMMNYCRKHNRLSRSSHTLTIKNLVKLTIIIVCLMVVSLIIYYGIHTWI